MTGSPPASLTQFVMRTCYHCRLAFLASCVICSDGKTDCSQTRGGERISTAHLSQLQTNTGKTVGSKKGLSAVLPLLSAQAKEEQPQSSSEEGQIMRFIYSYVQWFSFLFVLFVMFIYEFYSMKHKWLEWWKIKK